MIKFPLFGELLLKSIVARFARTLATLLSSGVPILSALLITRDTVGNVWVSAAITIVHDRVKEGATVAQPLVATGIFPPMVTSMIEVGRKRAACRRCSSRSGRSMKPKWTIPWRGSARCWNRSSFFFLRSSLGRLSSHFFADRAHRAAPDLGQASAPR